MAGSARQCKPAALARGGLESLARIPRLRFGLTNNHDILPSMIYDISPPLTSKLAVWPGDPALAREILCDGNPVTLSALHATAHLGAHADAPSHYGRLAASIDQCPLEWYLGPCQVMRVNAMRGQNIAPGMLPASIQAPRVLLATGTYPDPECFNDDFAGLAPELILFLSQHGVKLVGVDTPSVDCFDVKDLAAHRACLLHNIVILEGLMLGEVPAGLYELIALPLKTAPMS